MITIPLQDDQSPRLALRDALLINMAECGLALGVAEEAFRVIRELRTRATTHPDAVRVFQQLLRVAR